MVPAHLVVEHEDRVLAEMHDFKVERVVVFGNGQLTSRAIGFLLDICPILSPQQALRRGRPDRAGCKQNCVLVLWP